MADFKAGKKQDKATPRFIPAWGRIAQGRPFTTRGLEDENLVALKAPIKVSSQHEARALCEEYGKALYPSGPYEVRCASDGQLYLQHIEWGRRAKMWQYCRDTQADNVREQFNDQRGGKD